jgi:hypothetical protein
MYSPIAPIRFSSEYRFDFSQPNVLEEHSLGESGLAFLPSFATRYFIDDKKIAGYFGHTLEPLQADWVDVALACYFADRLALRNQHQSDQVFQWPRNFRLRLAVRKPEVWSSPGVSQELSDLLHFFTDDVWHFEFTARRQEGRLSEIQGTLLPPPPAPVKVALYSGGLDSFAGAVREVAECPEHSFIFVSASTNARQKSAQRKQVNAIRPLTRREVCHVIVPFGIKWGGEEHRKEEPSQRTRAFLFLTLGVITALNAGVETLHLFENGIGAINLPYDAAQSGAMNSRAVNPLSLLRMEKFVSRLTDRAFRIVNPVLFRTKAEMCRHEAVQSMPDAVALTFSCDGFPVRTSGKPQCGFCTSCLLRRLSLESAALSAHDAGGKYIADLLSPSFGGPSRQLQNLKAMEWQFHNLARGLAQADPWHSLAVEFPVLQTIVSELSSRSGEEVGELRQSILQLYEAYVSEWKGFSARERLYAKARAA